MNTEERNRYRGKYSEGCFVIGESLAPEEIKLILSHIYKVEAKRYIPDRVKHYANIMNLAPDQVRITSAFGRWGSCSGKKRLNFAWALMMADDDAIDAVIVHELSHMIHSNHSKNFYSSVYKYYPNYDSQHGQLKELSRRINRERWKK
jgi:predicted metal-dependent hydrolase